MAATVDLTDPTYWDAYWQEHVPELPVAVTRSNGPQVRAILDVFDRWLKPDPASAVLEVGGSPGRYLAYVQNLTGCTAAVLDYSPIGCDLTRRNFELLHTPVEVYEGDLFNSRDMRQFDAVYSLGVVEHFDNLGDVVAAHVRLVKPGGILIIGMPNFRGVNGWFAKRINRPRYLTHNVESMRLNGWDTFERELRLERLFRGPVGGFEPSMFVVPEEGLSRAKAPLVLLARVLERAALVAPFVRQFDHPLVSGYLMGVWRVAHVSI